MPRAERKYGVSKSYVDPRNPHMGSRWYVWEKGYSAWKKTELEVFMAKRITLPLRKKIIGLAKWKKVEPEIIKRMEEQYEQINRQDQDREGNQAAGDRDA